MPLTPAPFHADLAQGPPGGAAYWMECSDGVRIRVAAWPAEGARGTVLLFPGRTEYIEKYGDAARHLSARGFATLAVDWRGQGLADRLTGDARLGHVLRFSDYQKDVAAMLRAARGLDLPRPHYLLAHSMGGCIGLRAVMEGLGVQAAAFSGPMWGIHFGRAMKFMAMGVIYGGPLLGRGLTLSPSTRFEPYVEWADFKGNTLTRDPEMYQMMRDQIEAVPELALGGPTLHWLREAVNETRALARRASPDLRCVTFLGSDEAIVDVPRIYARMQTWTRGRLDVIEGGRHEVLMDPPEVRGPIFDRMAMLFAGE
ncbi:MAG TPA: alpha/beta hydrolase [Rhodobacteraceae bacterium]|nr:alpha/beta hydrolase [Paracoccaceae bacterium]